MTKSLFLGLALVLGLPCSASAQWRLDAWFGDAWNAHSPVTFHQKGEPDITIERPVWTTRPWAPTWYYSARVAKWAGDAAWAFEYQHHKLYLENPTEEVPVFRITNGINNLMGQRIWQVGAFEVGIGAGPVLAVPISKVRGRTFGGAHGIFKSRYELAGGTLQLNLARRVKLIPYTSGSFSVKGTATRLHVTIADGKADLMNYALHLQYGISLETKR